MTTETLILLATAYLGLVTVVMCVLMMAKRGDEAATAWHADDGRADDPPHHRDAA